MGLSQILGMIHATQTREGRKPVAEFKIGTRISFLFSFALRKTPTSHAKTENQKTGNEGDGGYKKRATIATSRLPPPHPPFLKIKRGMVCGFRIAIPTTDEGTHP
jgi:hypothetical protein